MATLEDSAAPSTPPTANHTAKAETLLTASNEGASALKGVFFSYVTALTYAIISVAGVTDEQLFREAPLSLPVLDVDIPLVEYFAILPLVVVLLHLQLMVQSALLSNKINEFKRELRHLPPDEREDLRLRLEDFMLARFLAGQHHVILRCLLFILLYAALVVLPLFALLLIQAQFLAYHSESMMWWHRILFTVDAIWLLYFWPNLFHRADMTPGAWARLMFVRVLPRAILLMLILVGIFVGLSMLHLPFQVILLVLIALLGVSIVISLGARSFLGLKDDDPRDDQIWNARAQRFEKYGRIVSQMVLWCLAAAILLTIVAAIWPLRPRDTGIHQVVPILTLVALVAAGAIVQFWARLSAQMRRMPAYIRKCHDDARQDDAPGMSIFGAQCIVGLLFCWLLLSAPSADEAKIDLSLICGQLPTVKAESGTARLSPDDFPAEPEEEVDMRSSLLSQALVSLAPDIAENVRSQSSVQKLDKSEQADLCADIWKTTLANDGVVRDATVLDIVVGSLGLSRYLMLEMKKPAPVAGSSEDNSSGGAESPAIEVDLSDRDLQWTDLTKISLSGAKGNAQTNLSNAVLAGVVLEHASLDKVDLMSADLSRAVLENVTARSVRLRKAILDNAKLRDANLEDSDLVDASMFGIEMINGSADYASFGGAALFETTFVGVDLQEADFSGTTLQGSTIKATSQSGSTFSGADLSDATFIGVSLDDARLDGVFASRSKFQGVDFTYAIFDGAFIYEPKITGSDLTYASFDNAIIINPISGKLEKKDAAALLKDDKMKDTYETQRDYYLENVQTSADTTWPSDEFDCLLIVPESTPATTFPLRCRFVLTMKEAPPEFTGGMPTYGGPAPTAEGLDQFWRNFGASQAQTLCQAPVDSAELPVYFASALFGALRYFENYADVVSAVTDGALPVLLKDECQVRWPEPVLKEVAQRFAESQQSWKVENEFLSAWIAEFEKREKPARSASQSTPH